MEGFCRSSTSFTDLTERNINGEECSTHVEDSVFQTRDGERENMRPSENCEKEDLSIKFCAFLDDNEGKHSITSELWPELEESSKLMGTQTLHEMTCTASVDKQMLGVGDGFDEASGVSSNSGLCDHQVKSEKNKSNTSEKQLCNEDGKRNAEEMSSTCCETNCRPISQRKSHHWGDKLLLPDFTSVGPKVHFPHYSSKQQQTYPGTAMQLDSDLNKSSPTVAKAAEDEQQALWQNVDSNDQNEYLSSDSSYHAVVSDLQALQELYHNLLVKHAEAELIIGELRQGAHVSLHVEPLQLEHSVQHFIPASPTQPLMLEIPLLQQAEICSSINSQNSTCLPDHGIERSSMRTKLSTIVQKSSTGGDAPSSHCPSNVTEKTSIDGGDTLLSSPQPSFPNLSDVQRTSNDNRDTILPSTQQWLQNTSNNGGDPSSLSTRSWIGNQLSIMRTTTSDCGDVLSSSTWPSIHKLSNTFQKTSISSGDSPSPRTYLGTQNESSTMLMASRDGIDGTSPNIELWDETVSSIVQDAYTNNVKLSSTITPFSKVSSTRDQSSTGKDSLSPNTCPVSTNISAEARFPHGFGVQAPEGA
uniref:Uncharacterized protein n=1 Tax=Eptatretus burgeri TaxID=7764 RepID=A0A8C4Q7H6_EPTBU